MSVLPTKTKRKNKIKIMYKIKRKASEIYIRYENLFLQTVHKYITYVRNAQIQQQHRNKQTNIDKRRSTKTYLMPQHSNVCAPQCQLRRHDICFLSVSFQICRQLICALRRVTAVSFLKTADFFVVSIRVCSAGTSLP